VPGSERAPAGGLPCNRALVRGAGRRRRGQGVSLGGGWRRHPPARRLARAGTGMRGRGADWGRPPAWWTPHCAWPSKRRPLEAADAGSSREPGGGARPKPSRRRAPGVPRRRHSSAHRAFPSRRAPLPAGPWAAKAWWPPHRVKPGPLSIHQPLTHSRRDPAREPARPRLSGGDRAAPTAAPGRAAARRQLPPRSPDFPAAVPTPSHLKLRPHPNRGPRPRKTRARGGGKKQTGRAGSRGPRLGVLAARTWLYVPRARPRRTSYSLGPGRVHLPPPRGPGPAGAGGPARCGGGSGRRFLVYWAGCAAGEGRPAGAAARAGARARGAACRGARARRRAQGGPRAHAADSRAPAARRRRSLAAPLPDPGPRAGTRQPCRCRASAFRR
jgi:hypothetical protein